jgi:pilus assembly protein Flp/PilA
MREKVLRAYIAMQSLKSALVDDQRGQDLIEYALVVSLIALAATVGMSSVATAIGSAFTKVGSKLGTYTS